MDKRRQRIRVRRFLQPLNLSRQTLYVQFVYCWHLIEKYLTYSNVNIYHILIGESNLIDLPKSNFIDLPEPIPFTFQSNPIDYPEPLNIPKKNRKQEMNIICSWKVHYITPHEQIVTKYCIVKMDLEEFIE